MDAVKGGEDVKKKNQWTVKHTGILLMAAVLVISLGAVLAAPVGNMVTKRNTQGAQGGTTKPLMPQQLAETEKKEAKREWRKQLEQQAARVEVPEALRDGASLVNLDGSLEEQRIKGFQRICVDKELTEAEKTILTDFVLAYPQQTETLYALYDFLYDYFFTKQDLQLAMQRCQNGENVESVLEDYFNIEQSYQPPQVESERVYYYIEERGLSADDSAIAKTLTFRQVSEYETIMGRLSSGETWEQIGIELELLNLSGRMRTLTVTQEEVQQTQKTLHISEEEAVSKVAEAKKANVPEEALTEYLRGKQSSGAALKQRSIDVYQSDEGRD